MIVGQALAWVSMIWINIAFLIGGVTDGGDWSNLYTPLIYDVFFFGLNALDYYLLLPKYTAFYRWQEQDWWKPKYTKWLETGGIKLDLDSEDDIVINGM